MTYVQKESQTNNHLFMQKTKLKSGIWKPVKYDKQRICVIGGVEAIADSTCVTFNFLYVAYI